VSLGAACAKDGDRQGSGERVPRPVDTVSDRDERESKQGRGTKRRNLACETMIEFHRAGTRRAVDET
jgi:hypothetical protein